MDKKKTYKILAILGGVLLFVYILFLLLPFILIPIFDNISSKITSEVAKTTGFKAEITKFRVVTTPKLTIGAKLGGLKVYTPDNSLLMSGDNFQLKFSILPLILRQVKLDLISSDDISVNLVVKKDGHFLVEDYFNDTKQNQEKAIINASDNADMKLPFGLKLSNNMPDFRLKAHKIAFIENDTNKKYVLEGKNTNITDFVLDKNIKIQSEGRLVLDDFEAFRYNVSVFNKIMPDINLNKLVFETEANEDKALDKNAQSFNIINIFETIKNNYFRLALFCDLKIEGDMASPLLLGKFSLKDLSMLVEGEKLPDSNIDIDFTKNKYLIDSNFYTSRFENTQLKGFVLNGKKPSIDLTCKSNATLKSIFNIVNIFAKIAGIEDLKTLKADGLFDINFNIKSDFETIVSNGYLKLLNGFINYGAYNVKIEDIVSDIKLDNNTVLIDKLAFSTMAIPLNVSGKIMPDATCDINVLTAKMPIKGLLISFGQAAVLKENPINSGTTSINLKILDKITAPKIEGDILLDSFNVKNIPSDIVFSMNPLNINLKTTDTGFNGTIKANDIKAVNPAVTASVATLSGTFDEKNINIQDTTLFVGKNETSVSGVISNYMTDKISLDFSTKGKIASVLNGVINPYKMTLDLKYSIPLDAEIIIPGFDKSKLKANGLVNITGSMLNPILKGQFTVPLVDIPEVPLVIKNMNLNLDGPILLGSATVSDFASGGILAKNIKSNFEMRDNYFYLNKMAGSAFDGTFSGDIVYNLSSTKCGVRLNGKTMNALKAIEGASGIKNALSGTLNFNADVYFKGVEYDEMMSTLGGSVIFDINNGVLANLGGLSTLLNAQNILSNAVLKTSTQKVSVLPVVQKASEFDYIKGKINFLNKYANLDSIEMSGPSMAYRVTGRYQLLNGTTNAIILGRLSEDIVGVMGNVGELAANKISSFIPALGSLTSSIVKSMNESPKNIKLDEIPSLRTAETKHKCFKVEFNGGVDSKSSVKSFKWLNDVDLTELNAKEKQAADIKATVDAAKTSIQSVVDDIKNQTTLTKDDIKNQVKTQAKDLLKSVLSPEATSSDSDGN